MFTPVVPSAFDDLAGVGFIFLDCGIGEHAHVVVYIKIEQGARLAAGLGDEERVECVMLKGKDKLERRRTRNGTAHMWNDEVFLKTRSRIRGMIRNESKDMP